MQLESHATPTRESPPQRYATLHRAIERGLDGDEVWNELAEVCLVLGLDDEAARCARQLRNPTLRLALESRLGRRGFGPDARPTDAAPPAAPPAATDPQQHVVAPAASDAGPTATATAQPAVRRDRFELGGLGEHLADAVQFLLWQRMPWLVLPILLSFPLVIGLGGLLTAGHAPLLLAALAAVPGLCVLAVVGAMGRRILVTSAAGGDDVPSLGETGPLLGDALRFLVDALLVASLLLAPPTAALYLGAPLLTTLPGLLVAAFFAPLAWGLRQVRGDLGALSPVTLLRGVARTGLPYLGLAISCLLAFAPAAATVAAVANRPVWVQIAIVGPLAVLPLFVVSRLLGTWLDSMRLELGAVLLGPHHRAPRTPRAAASVTTGAPRKPRFPQRPEALAHFAAPVVKTDAQRNRAERPARAAAAPPVPAAPAAASPPPPRQIEGKGPLRQGLDDTPDLSHMPGAVVVSGEDRVRQGAAARRS